MGHFESLLDGLALQDVDNAISLHAHHNRVTQLVVLVREGVLSSLMGN